MSFLSRIIFIFWTQVKFSTKVIAEQQIVFSLDPVFERIIASHRELKDVLQEANIT